MPNKIAISVEREVLEGIEKLRLRTHESRSAVFSRAARALLRSEERDRKVQRYQEAYREAPEDAAEVKRAAHLANGTLRGVTWEDE